MAKKSLQKECLRWILDRQMIVFGNWIKNFEYNFTSFTSACCKINNKIIVWLLLVERKRFNKMPLAETCEKRRKKQEKCQRKRNCLGMVCLSWFLIRTRMEKEWIWNSNYKAKWCFQQTVMKFLRKWGGGALSDGDRLGRDPRSGLGNSSTT